MGSLTHKLNLREYSPIQQQVAIYCIAQKNWHLSSVLFGLEPKIVARNPRFSFAKRSGATFLGCFVKQLTMHDCVNAEIGKGLRHNHLPVYLFNNYELASDTVSSFISIRTVRLK